MSSSQSAAPVAALLSQWIEPLVKPSLAAREPMRVLLLRVRNTGGLSISDTYFNQLRFNGKSALENGDAYHDAAFDFGASDSSAVVKEVLAFKPHVVLVPGVTGIAKDILTPIEDAWPAGAPKPHYLVGGYVVGDDFFAFLGKNAERRRRFLGVTPSSSTVANAKLMIHYNELFSPKVPRAATPGAVYDAMYALAYGIYALGDEPVTGRALAAELPRFSARSGDAGAPLRFDVGPTRIFDVFAAMRAGKPVDLDGAATRLDFDTATGDTTADFTVLCVDADREGNAHEAVESNVTYRAATGKLDGLPLHCR